MMKRLLLCVSAPLLLTACNIESVPPTEFTDESERAHITRSFNNTDVEALEGTATSCIALPSAVSGSLSVSATLFDDVGTALRALTLTPSPDVAAGEWELSNYEWHCYEAALMSLEPGERGQVDYTFTVDSPETRVFTNLILVDSESGSYITKNVETHQLLTSDTAAPHWVPADVDAVGDYLIADYDIENGTTSFTLVESDSATSTELAVLKGDGVVSLGVYEGRANLDTAPEGYFVKEELFDSNTTSLYFSSDLIDWSEPVEFASGELNQLEYARNIDTYYYFGRINYGDDADEDRTLYTSTDGVSWSPQASLTNELVYVNDAGVILSKPKPTDEEFDVWKAGDASVTTVEWKTDFPEPELENLLVGTVDTQGEVFWMAVSQTSDAGTREWLGNSTDGLSWQWREMTDEPVDNSLFYTWHNIFVLDDTTMMFSGAGEIQVSTNSGSTWKTLGGVGSFFPYVDNDFMTEIRLTDAAAVNDGYVLMVRGRPPGNESVDFVMRTSDFESFALDYMGFSHSTPSVSNGELFTYEEGGILGEVLYRHVEATPENDSEPEANPGGTETKKKRSGGALGGEFFVMLLMSMIFLRRVSLWHRRKIE